MANIAYPDTSRAGAPKGAGIKLTARIVEWDHARGRGTISFEKHRIPLQRDDFLVHHTRPEVGDVVEFRLGRDEAGRITAQEVEHRNDGGRIRFWHLLELLVLMAAPGYALFQLADRNDWRLVVGCVLGLSTVGFLLYWLDKLRARHGQWRVAESSLHLVAFLGGWPGAFLAQRHFRHKTGKVRFQLVFWLIVTLHQFLAFDYLQDWTALRAANTAFRQTTMPAPK